MKHDEAYAEQVRALQMAAGIRIKEEVTVSSSGVEEDYDAYEDGTDPDGKEFSDAPLEEKEMYGYDGILDAANGIRAAEEAINKLVADPKFNDRFKRDFQAYSIKLKTMSKDLTNIASPGKSKKLEL